MSEARRVLMVAPYFPPRNRVGAARPHKLAVELTRLGWSPSVVHLAASGVMPPDLEPVARLAIDVPRDRTAVRGGRSLALRRARPGRGALERVDDLLPVDAWAAPLWWFRRSVLRFARARDPDVIWSTADPWSSHLLAAHVARRLDRPWVADFRDPWTLCRVRTARRPDWVRAVDRRVEARVIERADRLVFTAERTRALYADAYPRHADRMRVVTNGYVGEVQPFSATPTGSAGAGRIVLRFFGRFRPLSSARRIIRVLKELRALDLEAFRSVEVRSVGGLDDTDRRRAEAAGVAPAFVAEQAVDRAARPERLSSSDLLLLSVEPGRDEILPAKLFDYLAAGRPVFALADSPEVAEILARTNTGVMFGDDADPLAAGYLARSVRAARAGEDLPDVGPARPEVIARWSSAAVAERMAGVLVEAIDPTGSSPARPNENR
jgi:glycosyltransferase involved in cell wall biosynthesis